MDSVIEEKYWMVPGICAEHKSSGHRVTVEYIKKEKNKEGKTFVKGVMCHWLNEQGGYETGMFMTMELQKCIE
jgi:hypothetical protein